VLVRAKRKVAEGIDGKHRDEDKHDCGRHARGPTVTRQKQGGDRKDSAGEDPAPPFQDGIESNVIVQVESVRGVDQFAEDEKRNKNRRQESGERNSPPKEHDSKHQHQKRPPHDQKLRERCVRFRGHECEVHVAGFAADPGEKGNQEQHPGTGTGREIAHVPCA
jgi:hypothetical protein